MNENIDVYVCKPDVGINKALSGMFIQFEVMDRDKTPTGKPHTVAMTTSDAMRLLATLIHIQKKFDLPVPEGFPMMSEISKKTN
jgi:hypothetical protein